MPFFVVVVCAVLSRFQFNAKHTINHFTNQARKLQPNMLTFEKTNVILLLSHNVNVEKKNMTKYIFHVNPLLKQHLSVTLIP